jgi:hypothetical protein
MILKSPNSRHWAKVMMNVMQVRYWRPTLFTLVEIQLWLLREFTRSPISLNKASNHLSLMMTRCHLNLKRSYPVVYWIRIICYNPSFYPLIRFRPVSVEGLVSQVPSKGFAVQQSISYKLITNWQPRSNISTCTLCVLGLTGFQTP